jgi:hypothetical protein
MQRFGLPPHLIWVSFRPMRNSGHERTIATCRAKQLKSISSVGKLVLIFIVNLKRKWSMLFPAGRRRAHVRCASVATVALRCGAGVVAREIFPRTGGCPHRVASPPSSSSIVKPGGGLRSERELRLGDGDLLQRGDVELLEHLPDECSDGLSRSRRGSCRVIAKAGEARMLWREREVSRVAENFVHEERMHATLQRGLGRFLSLDRPLPGRASGN